MSGVIALYPSHQFFDATGPLVGGEVNVYLAGTTTRTNTWQDRAQTTLNANPIELDSYGQGQIWLDPTLTYKLVVKNSLGVTVTTMDNVTGAAGSETVAAVTAAGA